MYDCAFQIKIKFLSNEKAGYLCTCLILSTLIRVRHKIISLFEFVLNICAITTVLSFYYRDTR